jgi:hypothetical protein
MPGQGSEERRDGPEISPRGHIQPAPRFAFTRDNKTRPIEVQLSDFTGRVREGNTILQD